MSQSYVHGLVPQYALLVSLPLAEGGHVVVDAEQIVCISDGRPRADESPRCWLFLHSDQRFELDGTAKDALAEVNDQRERALRRLAVASGAREL